MTQRLACPPAPGPLEEFAARFDDLFGTLAQRRGFRDYLQGLLSPRERNKTLTALAGAEPVVGAQHPEVQRLQFFLSESTWDPAAINARRLELLLADPATAAHEAGALIIDDTGDRKDGTRTAHVARQYLGSVGKVENGIVAVTSLWADERVYYPLHAEPYTPAERLGKGKKDPAFHTKPQIAVGLVDAALRAGVPFRAVVADCTYGENPTFEGALWDAALPFVLGLKPSRGTWAPAEDAHTPEEAAHRLRWGGPDEPGDWTAIERAFRDGHTETWWAAEVTLGGYGPEAAVRLVVATTDPATLPALGTRYLTTNLPRPGSPRAADSPWAPADLAEVVRLYALRNWVEQGYKQGKHELGWADFQVRGDQAIRRHWTLVCCAFSFCWRAWFGQPAGAAEDAVPTPEPGPALLPVGAVATDAAVGGKIGGHRPARRRRARGRTGRLAPHTPTGARLAGPLDFPLALLARVVAGAPATRVPGAPPLGRGRSPAQPVSPHLTKYR
jgi:hypothetical protein